MFILILWLKGPKLPSKLVGPFATEELAIDYLDKNEKEYLLRNRGEYCTSAFIQKLTAPAP